MRYSPLWSVPWIFRLVFLFLFPASAIVIFPDVGCAGDGAIDAQDGVTGDRVVIPFDFISRYDNGVNGRKVAELIRVKVAKLDGFVVPETIQDVRDTLEINGTELSGSTTVEEYGSLVRDVFDAQIGIWGSMEPVSGTVYDEYHLTIHCVDFSVSPPETVYEVSTRTKTVSEIPHTYVPEMLTELSGGTYRPVDRTSSLYATGEEVDRRWSSGKNLLGEARFDRLTEGIPDGWEPYCGQLREPFGTLVRVVRESTTSFLRFEFPASVGDNEGCLYYSKPFPIEEGAVYRFQCHYRTSGPSVKVFIKCYDEVASEYAEKSEITKDTGSEKSGRNAVDRKNSGRRDRADGSDARSSSAGRRPGSRGSKGVQYREVYRSQQNLTVERDRSVGDGWFVHTEDFTPKHTSYSPKLGRIMLYAYIGAGTVDWDDVILKKVVDAPPDLKKGPLRHSLESGVTIDDQDAIDRGDSERSTKNPTGKNPPERKEKGRKGTGKTG
ncbi:MAG: hypothetical protein Q4C47_05025 [Planctomycetia bacterium]|nr:hypothetical protein [Planctomycetia bacterium]